MERPIERERQTEKSRYEQTSLYDVLMKLDQDVQSTLHLIKDEKKSKKELETEREREGEREIELEDFFSYEHFYVLYCLFYQIDEDGDGFISRNELQRLYQYGAMTSLVIER
jgi:serine/threonine-protein phosphatase 2A regulatory subunit B''